MTKLQQMRDAVARGQRRPAAPAPVPTPPPQPVAAADTTLPTPVPVVPRPEPEAALPPKPKKKAWHKGPAKPPAYFDNVQQVKGRLPDGSRYEVEFDAAAKQWAGTLAIPATPETDAKVFEASACGVFTLLATLDDQYRAWKAETRRAAAG